MTTNISVLVSGRGSNFQSILDAAAEGLIKDVNFACVISDKKEAKALERARDNNIEAVFVDPKSFSSRAEFDREVIRILKEHDTDLVLLAGYMRIITEELVDAYAGKIMNIHPALLPAFKGLHAQKQALDYGVKVAGCTVHFVEADLDAGPIIIQRTVPVLPGDTEDSLADRILVEEHKAYPEAVRLFAEGKLEIRGRNVIIKE
ncbi:phosphoribosylglycinamide formyltransferase [Methanosarcinaceae archaeon]|nr:phosphoribosylglycinamide formyltransferase [Methanosarcinaceae archaeon]MBQ3620777.1 phosphoribosylglycinamide formyltransferase [Methanosarcinaceae archaeon]